AEFVVTVDLPGFEKADVDVSVTDHTLRIEAEHEETTDERSDQYLRHERRHDSLHRAIRLPEAVDKARVEARMQNGVLTVTVPKLEVDEVRTIDVA
ncbi:MAG: Hsp20/alpha crystallin family protein, partial [Halolamina sp.]